MHASHIFKWIKASFANEGRHMSVLFLCAKNLTGLMCRYIYIFTFKTF